MIKLVKGPVTMEICDGKNVLKLSILANCLQHCYVSGRHDAAELSNTANENYCLKWTPPSVEHFILLPIEQNIPSCYPQRQRRPPRITHHKLVVKLKTRGGSVVLITY